MGTQRFTNGWEPQLATVTGFFPELGDVFFILIAKSRMHSQKALSTDHIKPLPELGCTKPPAAGTESWHSPRRCHTILDALKCSGSGDMLE